MWYSGSSVSELRCWVRFESAGSINTRLSLVHFCNHWSRLKSSPRFACSSSAVFWGGAASCWWSVVIEVPRSFRRSTGSSHYPSKPQFKEIVFLYTCLLFLPFPPLLFVISVLLLFVLCAFVSRCRNIAATSVFWTLLKVKLHSYYQWSDASGGRGGYS